jgi:hypothetical protein
MYDSASPDERGADKTCKRKLRPVEGIFARLGRGYAIREQGYSGLRFLYINEGKGRGIGLITSKAL